MVGVSRMYWKLGGEPLWMGGVAGGATSLY
jgi:hypothetical protein